MAELILSGVTARCMEPNDLGAVVQSASTRPGKAFRRFFEEGTFDEARARTSHTGALDEAAACALIDCVNQCGTPFGGLDVEPAEADVFPARFLELATIALDDERAAQRLFDGGVLDRVGSGRHFFGSLPVRIIARQFDATTKAAARALLQGGWDEDLLNLIESAALRATQFPEELLVLTPTWREPVPVPVEAPAVVEPSAPPPADVDVLSWLELARSEGATDLSLVMGQPLALHGAFGRRVVGAALTASDLEDVLTTLLDASTRERFEREGALVAGFSVQGFGRFRLTALTERGERSLSIRTHFVAPQPVLPPEVLEPLSRISRGLVVVASPAGQGRSTVLTGLLSLRASEVVTLEEPVSWPALRGPVRQVELHTDSSLAAFAVTARTLPNAVVGLDLVDDEAAAHLALELASEGQLVFVTQRGLSAAATLHKLAALDSKRARRRLSESLSAVLSLRLVANGSRFVHAAELLLPTEALRRHLRGNETPPPPVVLETEGLSLDDRLLAAVRRGDLPAELASRWMVDARRLADGQ